MIAALRDYNATWKSQGDSAATPTRRVVTRRRKGRCARGSTIIEGTVGEAL